MQDLSQRLGELQAQHRYRRVLTRSGPQDHHIQIQGKTYLNFCSNDYLGLSNHPEVKSAFHAGIECYGVGSGASHLINGHTQAHTDLEAALAELTGRPRALLYSTGYMANLGTISSLVGRHDAVFEDRLNHASLLDAGLSSAAPCRRYAHADTGALAKMLSRSKAKQKLIVTDGVFSMDGDVAPIVELVALAKQYHAWLMVDDAHGFGVLGKHGAGLLQQHQLGLHDVPILMGTLGKALGTAGAFIAGSDELIEMLIQQSRTYIYTTAMPPAIAVATLAALHVMAVETWRRQHLHAMIACFTQQMLAQDLPVLSTSAIQPVMVGSDQAALQASQRLADAGLMVTAIRPPTVPIGTARLRVTLSAFHTSAQVEQLVCCIAQLPQVRQ